jgi:predicted molibdopterin-dependent oxidoreductase YjgC
MGLYSIKFVKCGNCPESCKILVVLPSIKIQNKNVETRIKYSESRQTSVYSGFSRWDCKVCLVSAGLRFTQHSVDGAVSDFTVPSTER